MVVVITTVIDAKLADMHFHVSHFLLVAHIRSTVVTILQSIAVASEVYFISSIGFQEHVPADNTADNS